MPLEINLALDFQMMTQMIAGTSPVGSARGILVETGDFLQTEGSDFLITET